ncbi:MAG: FtsQ-type POTRA domain-containing protein, partial [Actinobacteria bacterium]|nr:FtsQ-type POTRA domain-containing protein [Actinomycetota bacterium]
MQRPEGFSATKTPGTRPPGRPQRGGSAQGAVREATQRRRRAEKAEFTGLTAVTRRRRRVWALSLGSIAVVVLATVVLVLSPVLALRDVQVEGSHTVPETDIQQALSGLYGEPLARISNDRVADALSSIRVIQAFET